MTEHGVYDGWTEHMVTVRPSLLCGFTLNVGGRNRNEVKELIGETFQDCLSKEVEDA